MLSLGRTRCVTCGNVVCVAAPRTSLRLIWSLAECHVQRRPVCKYYWLSGCETVMQTENIHNLLMTKRPSQRGFWCSQRQPVATCQPVEEYTLLSNDWRFPGDYTSFKSTRSPRPVALTYLVHCTASSLQTSLRGHSKQAGMWTSAWILGSLSDGLIFLILI